MSFVSLFSATLISKDRSGALMQRLYTTPMTPFDYICGYTLPMLPLSVLQTIICYLAAFTVGLKFSANVICAILSSIIISPLFIAIGLLCGTLLSDKQVGGICGALLTNLTAWLSGIWFELSLVGGVFEKIADCLPFVHAVELERAILSGNTEGIMMHLAVVPGYTVVIFVTATLIFKHKMNK